MRSMVSALMTIVLLIGCFQPSSPLVAFVDAPELATLTMAEVARLAKSVDQPVIVEFSVLHGCDRCAKMRPTYVLFAPGVSPRIHTTPELLISLADRSHMAIAR